MPTHASPYGGVQLPTGTLTEYVFRDVARRGDAVVCIDGVTGASLTGAALLREVRRTAAGLQRRGLAKGDVLAVWSPNSLGYVVAFHATIAAGGVVTTLNPAYTAREVAQQLDNAGAVYLVTTPTFLPQVAEARKQYGGLREVFVVGDGAAGAASPFAALQIDADPAPVAIDAANDVCVLPYSSGTTGLPKGTMLTHLNITANLEQMRHPQVLRLSPEDTLLAVLPFYHIYGMVVIMNLAICEGARFVTMPGFDPPLYLRLLKKYDVTIAHVAPPLVQFLAKSPAVAEHLPLPRLRELFCGAAPLGAELTQEVRKRLGGVEVRQGYGLTETSPGAIIDRPRGAKLGGVGYLLPGMECRLVDPESGREQPRGGVAEAGEVWLRGPNIMKGYHRNEAATRGCIDADGWFHTGDIAYSDADGCFFVIDRLKELIKAKGFQVAPAELEALLMKHAGVADAAVIGAPAEKYGGRESDGEVPKAFVVRQPGGGLTAAGLAEWLSPQVAAYKRLRPQAIEFVDAVPKSPSGKILRKDLRKVEQGTGAAKAKL